MALAGRRSRGGDLGHDRCRTERFRGDDRRLQRDTRLDDLRLGWPGADPRRQVAVTDTLA